MKVHVLLPAILCLAACSPAQPDKSPEKTSTTASSVAAVPTPPLASASELPVAFVGSWDVAPDPCSKPYRSDMQLDITATELTFFESGGHIKRVKVNGPYDVVADVAMSGEGETWERPYHLVLSDDGNTLTLDEGKSGIRVRCPKQG